MATFTATDQGGGTVFFSTAGTDYGLGVAQYETLAGICMPNGPLFGAPIDRTWTFGDGTTVSGAGATISHTYYAPPTDGTYSVTFTLVSTLGTDSETKNVTVTGAQPKPPPPATTSPAATTSPPSAPGAGSSPSGQRAAALRKCKKKTGKALKKCKKTALKLPT